MRELFTCMIIHELRLVLQNKIDKFSSIEPTSIKHEQLLDKKIKDYKDELGDIEYKVESLMNGIVFTGLEELEDPEEELCACGQGQLGKCLICDLSEETGVRRCPNCSMKGDWDECPQCGTPLGQDKNVTVAHSAQVRWQVDAKDNLSKDDYILVKNSIRTEKYTHIVSYLLNQDKEILDRYIDTLSNDSKYNKLSTGERKEFLAKKRLLVAKKIVDISAQGGKLGDIARKDLEEYVGGKRTNKNEITRYFAAAKRL